MPPRGHEAPLGPPRAAGPDVPAQRAHDRRRPVGWHTWEARTRAVDEALAAVEAGEADEAPPRQVRMAHGEPLHRGASF